MFDTFPDHARLQSIGLTPSLTSSFPPLADGDAAMRVVEVRRDSLLLHDGETVQPARALPALLSALAAADDALATGDWVVASRTGTDEWWVHTRIPPASQIARRLHDGRDKLARAVLAANVDTALLVMGLDLDFNLRRLERYLAFARLAGIGAVVVLTKADQVDDAVRRTRVQEAQRSSPPGVAVLALDGRCPGATAALEPWLGSGQTLVLVGSSGAGKSTLTNTLAGRTLQATGGTRKGDGRGRHTTTARTLHRLPGGACLIDTPGLRTLRLDADADQLTQAFDDVARLAPACRFRDCRHESEPGCAVREALPAARLKNFHKLQREARRDTMSVLERQALLTTWKVRTRAGRERLKEKKQG